MPKYSRRDLGLLLPALAAATASAQNPAADNSVEKLPVLKTHAYLFNEVPETVNGKNKQRRLFTGKLHTGFKLESHQSDIAPGEVNHPPHQHLREEMMLIREGTMELTISGKLHTGFKLESHQSDIAPGEVNHPPHQHLREEMMLIREGTMELTISGK